MQGTIAPLTVYAEEATPTPEVTQSEESPQTTEEVTPTPTETEQQPSDETSSEEPTVTPEQITPTPTETREQQREREREERRQQMKAEGKKEEGDPNRKKSETSAAVQGVNPTTTQNAVPDTSKTGGNVGNSSITTGDATNGAAVVTGANNNAAATTTGSGTGATVANTNNGTGSNNNGSATITNNNATNQNNTAVVNNDLTGASISGQNQLSNNVGNSDITTGDANTSGTLITTVNTNAQGIMVSEFNVVDDHIGDIVLDFAANCISGCDSPNAVANAGNGSYSTNTLSVDEKTINDTFQNNDATVGNSLVLSADSGNNTASRNTGGDSNITTGDANVSANVLTFANNNIAGNVIIGTVNIYGDLIGDIILTEEELARYGVTNNASNSGNGSHSQNTASIDQTTNNNTFQNNDANITNSIVYDAQTGNNTASGNTGGNSSITTGDTNVLANVLNIANTNVAGGNMWLVIVNQAGKWVGKLMGAPEGSMFAGSSEFEFEIDENGEVTASNNGNGSGSTNTASASQEKNNNTTQNNTADIHNTLDLSANTGGNETSNNTGGDSKIKTGDATIIANIVNFVNNNVSGNGTLFVTVINVFGTWMGDFVAPGQTKEPKTEVAQNNTNNNQSQNKTETSSKESSNKVTESVTVTSTTKQKAVMADDDSTIESEITGKTRYFEKTVLASSDTENGTSLVKGSHFDKTTVDGKYKINLAWIIVALPIAALIIIMRKVSSKLLLRKS